MTRADLEQLVKELLGKEQVDVNAFYTPDELLRAIQRAHLDTAYDLKVPRRLFEVSTPAPFSLPAEAWGAGLISITDAETSKQLRIYSVEEANQRFPGWQELEVDTSTPQFAIYDPGNVSTPVYIVPPHTVERKYYLHYTIKPAELSSDTSVPFNSDPDLEPLHALIAYKAAAYLFETDKTADGVHQANRMRQHYKLEKARLVGKTLRPSRLRVRNPLWRSFFNGR